MKTIDLWAEFEKDPANVYRWRACALKQLWNLPPPESALDLNAYVSKELDRRGKAWVERRFRSERLVPIVVATKGDGLRLPGLLFWFALRDDDEAHGSGAQVRKLLHVKHDNWFRVAVMQGLSRCRHGDRLYLEVEEGPVFQDQPFKDKSAGLAAAVWGTWYQRGEWPDTPIAISGEVTETGEVRPVEGVEAKLEGARDCGVDWLVVPDDGSLGPADGLIRVPITGKSGQFEAWLARCEKMLSEHGIGITPHPALWRQWGPETETTLRQWNKDDWRRESDAVPPQDRAEFYWKHLAERDLETFKLVDSRVQPPVPLLAVTVGKDKVQALPFLLAGKLEPRQVLWLSTDESAEDLRVALGRMKDWGLPTGQEKSGTPTEWAEAITNALESLRAEQQACAVLDVTGGRKSDSIHLMALLRGFPGMVTYTHTPEFTKANHPAPFDRELRILIAADGPLVSR